MVNRTRGIFAYLINQSTLAYNGILKHFKLGINKESKDFQRKKDRQESASRKLYKRVG
tara:strand:+ start:2527 stop:2700 length:174 start_codon:yes stop_codon:yes gene_type:complete